MDMSFTKSNPIRRAIARDRKLKAMIKKAKNGYYRKCLYVDIPPATLDILKQTVSIT